MDGDHLFLANRAQQIDTRNGADTRAIDEMARISAYEAQNARIPSMTDRWVIVGVWRRWRRPGPRHRRARCRGWFKANISWASQFSLDSGSVWVILCPRRWAWA